MGAIDSVVLAISNILYQPWFVPLILIGGAIYLTIRCGFLQFAWKSLMKAAFPPLVP